MIVHEFQNKVALLLYNFLAGDANANTNYFDEEISTTTTLAIGDDATRTSPNTTMMIQFTQIPINVSTLRPLASYIAIIEQNKKNMSNHSFKATKERKTYLHKSKQPKQKEQKKNRARKKLWLPMIELSVLSSKHCGKWNRGTFSSS